MGRQNPGNRDKAYRLVLLDDNTHKGIKMVRFTKTGAIFWVVAVMIALIAVIYCAIALTPLRTTIPGYPDAHSKKVAVANAIKIDSLELAMKRWHIYAVNLDRVLNGESPLSIDSIISPNGKSGIISSKTRKELSKQDSILRTSVVKAERFGVSEKNRDIPIEGMHFFTPLKGIVTREFSSATHPGIDISAGSGSIVSCILDGTVVYAGWDEKHEGIVVMQHTGNIISIYGGNGRTLVSEGAEIKAGTPIAICESSDKNQLHLELWYNGRAIDPAKYIGF